MAFAYFDRVKETTTTTGVGVIVLAGAVLGFRAFSAVYANNDTLHYTIYHAASGAWEVGYGTWNTGNQLTRTTVLASSNAGAAVNFAAGTKDVFVTFPAGVPSSQGASFFSVANAAERTGIPAAVLRLGALARQIDTGVFYHWTGSAWTVFIGFAPTASATGQTQIWNGTAWVAGALDLADLDAVTGQLAHANLANLTGLSVFGRATNSIGVMAAITGTADQALRVNSAGTALGFGTLATAAYADASVTIPKLADLTALSVIGRATNTLGVPAAITAGVVGHVLRYAGTSIGFGPLDLSDPDATTGTLPFGSLATIGTATLLGRTTAGTGAVEQLTLNTTLSFSGSTLQRAALSGDVTATAGSNTTAITADVIVDADINTAAAISYSKLAATGNALSVLGRAANTAGAIALITAALTGQSLRYAGTSIGFGAIDLASANSITGLMPLANLTGGSAIGQVLRNTAGNVPQWGALDLADPDAITGQVPFANLPTIPTDYLVGRDTAGSGVPEAIGLNATLEMSGTGFLRRSALIGDVTALAGDNTLTIAAGVIIDSKISAGAAIAVTKLAGGSAIGQVLRNTSGNVPAWGAVDLADPDAVTGLLGFANMASLNGLSVLGRAASTSGVMAGIPGTANQVLRVDSGATTLGFGNITGAIIDLNTITYSRLAQSVGAPSILGRGSASNGNIGEISAVTDGHTLRRIGGALSFGALDLADPDAVTGQLPTANLANGVNGRVLVTVAAAATWGAAIGNSTDAFSYNGLTHTFQVAGTTTLTLNSISIKPSVSAFTFLNTVASPVIGQDTRTTAAAVGENFRVEAMDVTGTGATVGGGLHMRAGHSTNGTGGDVILTAGDGVTRRGTFTVKSGSSDTMLEVAHVAGARRVVGLFGSVTATEMPTNSGDKVLFMTARAAAPTVSPVGGLSMFSSVYGELVTVATANMNMKLGDGSNAVELRAGGATDYDIHFYTNDAVGASHSGTHYHTRLSGSYLSFDEDSTGPGSVFDFRYRTVTGMSIAKSGGSLPQLSFYGKVPTVVQAADPVALTAGSGTADNTIADVGAAFNQTTLNNNFKDLATKYNLVRDILRNVGLAA